MKTKKLEEILSKTHDSEIFIQLNGVYYPITNVDVTNDYVVIKIKDIVLTRH